MGGSVVSSIGISNGKSCLVAEATSALLHGGFLESPLSSFLEEKGLEEKIEKERQGSSLKGALVSLTDEDWIVK